MAHPVIKGITIPAPKAISILAKTYFRTILLDLVGKKRVWNPEEGGSVDRDSWILKIIPGPIILNIAAPT